MLQVVEGVGEGVEGQMMAGFGGGGFSGVCEQTEVQCAHLAVQHSVGQLPPRLLDDLADFLQLLLCLRCLVLRLLLLPATEAQFRRKKTLIKKEKNVVVNR